MSVPILAVGDMMPALVLPDATGAMMDVAHQSLAGRHRLLIFGPPPEAATLARAGAAVPVFLVQRSLGAALADGTTVLHDAEGKVTAALGLSGGGAALIDPRNRLAFRAEGATATERALAAIPATPPATVRRTGAPVLIVPDILEPALVSAMLAHWERGTKSRDRTASAAGAATVTQQIKRRTDVVLDDMALYDAFRIRIERRVAPELIRAFRFRPARFEAPRIGCYDAADQGAFGPHRDNRTPFTAHRRFAMSLNLNSGAYEGGTVRFAEFGPDSYDPPTGGAVLFCCDLLHEALPVTAGRRFALFTFLTDREGAEQERRLMEQRLAAGDRGVALS